MNLAEGARVWLWDGGGSAPAGPALVLELAESALGTLHQPPQGAPSGQQCFPPALRLTPS